MICETQPCGEQVRRRMAEGRDERKWWKEEKQIWEAVTREEEKTWKGRKSMEEREGKEYLQSWKVNFAISRNLLGRLQLLTRQVLAVLEVTSCYCSYCCEKAEVLALMNYAAYFIFGFDKDYWSSKSWIEKAFFLSLINHYLNFHTHLHTSAAIWNCTYKCRDFTVHKHCRKW